MGNSPPDDWLLGPPVKWVGMVDDFLGQQQVAQFFQNSWQDLVIELTFKIRTGCFIHETAAVHCHCYFQIVLDTDIVVILTKTWSRMDNPCTRFSRDMITQNDQLIHMAIPRVLGHNMLQVSPFILGNNLKTFPTKLRSQGIQ